MNKTKLMLAAIAISFSLASVPSVAGPTKAPPPSDFVAEKAIFADGFHSLAKY